MKEEKNLLSGFADHVSSVHTVKVYESVNLKDLKTLFEFRAKMPVYFSWSTEIM